MKIDSPQNPVIKETCLLHQKKRREEQGLILVEGEHAVEEAVKAGLTLRSFFQKEETDSSFNLPGIERYVVSERVMSKLATTESAPACVAVAVRPAVSLEPLLASSHALLLLIDQVQDPGNLGAIIRSAVAFGVDGLLLTPGTVDPYSPKVIRASAGLVFARPIITTPSPLLGSIGLLRQNGFQVLCTTGHRSVKTFSYRDVQYEARCALLFGNEGAGLPDDAFSLTHQALMIPISPQVESLNVAISASIILAEAAHQQRARQEGGL